MAIQQDADYFKSRLAVNDTQPSVDPDDLNYFKKRLGISDNKDESLDEISKVAGVKQQPKKSGGIVSNLISGSMNFLKGGGMFNPAGGLYSVMTKGGEKQATEKVTKAIAPKAVEDFGETLGTAVGGRGAQKVVEQGLTDKLSMDQQLIGLLRKADAEGNTEKSAFYRKLMQKSINDEPITAEDIAPALTKSGRKVFGEALGVLGWMSLGASAPATGMGRIAFGTGVGTGGGLKSGLEDETKGAQGIIAETAKGAAMGMLTSSLFEAAGAAARSFGQRKNAGKGLEAIAGKEYVRELQPPTKELAKDIEKGFKTFGDEVAQQVDDAGKPIYVGTYKTIKSQADKQLSVNGKRLAEELKKYPDVTVSRNEVAQDVITQMQDKYGKLKKSQLDQIKFEVNRMPSKMKLTDVQDAKLMYDELIPESFWQKIDDPAQAFPSLVKYNLRDNARKIINQKTGGVANSVNEKMRIAMDVRKLASAQIASRMKSKATGLGNKVMKIIDDTIFNPAITTRGSQTAMKASKAIKQLGTKTGQTLLRHAARTGAIGTMASKTTLTD